MTSLTSGQSSSATNLGFVFNGAGKGVKLNLPSDVAVQSAPKES